MCFITYNEKGGDIMPQFEVVFFEKEDGSCPAEAYLLSLPLKMRTRVYKIIGLLEEYGNHVRMPYSEGLQDGIFQIRAQQEGNISRVLYFFTSGKRIVLTNGFTKKTTRTPQSEIELAKKYRTEYEKQEEGHRR